ncbi:MAG: hypothetical protein IKD47_04895 [Clostridia bacterium]|nr:hypothetical protein [Clostridia bacterium]
MEIKIEEYLRDLGLTGATIARATSEENYENCRQLLRKNPQITKKEFLTQMWIAEYED